MKVLLTGASGFVGSHILDRLRAHGIATAVLLRPTSNRRFLAHHLPDLEIRIGSVTEPAPLRDALADITHVIHCAGLVKALQVQEYFSVNQVGTRNLVDAINQRGNQVQRLVYISSLAAAGPSEPNEPLTERVKPRPVSEYGRSKLAGEKGIIENSKTDFCILRPAAVYGPRDTEFLMLFKAVQHHLLPLFGGGRQGLSLVYVEDLAAATVASLTSPMASGKTFFVANPEIRTSRQLAAEIATQMDRWTIPLHLPTALLWPLCLWEEMRARLTQKPGVVSLQKYPELCARAWICNPARLQAEVRIGCATGLQEGVGKTIAWYRCERWLT